MRLTEVEVHGSDLEVGLEPWSATFVDAALPMRVRWLQSRRSNHGDADDTIEGSWNLVSLDGPVFNVRTSGRRVQVVAAPDPDADATIGGSGAELLAMLLGRLDVGSLDVRGDLRLASAFHNAFPPP